MWKLRKRSLSQEQYSAVVRNVDLKSDRPRFKVCCLLGGSRFSGYTGSVSLGFLVHKEACQDNNLPRTVVKNEMREPT